MAEQQQQNPGAVTNSFTKGMAKDMNETFIGDGVWTHARNLVNNNHDGQTGVVGNEPANLHCVTLPYDLIGAIHITDDQWAVFTTDDTNSEIGLFDESKCQYTKVVNDPCLGFKRSHLITGSSRKRFDCERPVYFADGLNPDRFIDFDNIPWKYTETYTDGCAVKKIIEPRQLDCEKIRMAPLLKHPCITIKKGQLSGTLPNGSYQAVAAYSEAGVRFSSYMGLSEVQSLFAHENVSSSLELFISDIDTTYDEFELVILARINGSTVAKKIGNYSTSTGTIYIDRWDEEFQTVPIAQIVFRGDASEKSDAMYEVNNYLLKVGDYSKFKFNYQKQANQIKANWVAVEYPSDYYVKGGNNTGYLRDEQYSFFIRFVYNTGDRTESYHIPGRPFNAGDRQNVIGGDAFETTGSNPVTRERWQVENTASVTNLTSSTLPDGGRVIASGDMGYWESTEQYPDNRLDIWGNLCGKKIRHHKMPDVTINGGSVVNHFSNNGSTITILGVEFSNITAPLDNKGNPIASIVGYELLRGSREGNQSIIGKGLINNMREYDIPTNTSVRGLFQNYPYNDLSPDKFLTEAPKKDSDGIIQGQANVSTPEMDGISKRIFSFHGPEVTFSNPFLNSSEVKIYQEMTGTSRGQFETPYRHPKFKVLNNTATVISSIVGILSAVNIFSSGITVGATEDHPIGLQLGPLQPFPQRPRPVVGVGSTTIPDPDIISEATYYAQLTLWAANLVGLVSAVEKFADLQKEKFLSLMRTLIPKKQYAAQYVSHGFYDNSTPSVQGNRRRRIVDANYISSGIQSFNIQYQINNTHRSKMVVFQTDVDIENPVVKDNSRITLGELNTGLYQPVTRTISSHYGALKISIPSQYGQLDSIKQLPISAGCVLPITPDKNKVFKTPVLFGGDTYINRFTEKNTMVFFTDWLMGEPDEAEYDYSLYINIPYPRFWINNTEYSGSVLEQASSLRALDWRKSPVGSIYVHRGYFYLFNSGVRDFFVESEVNVAFRDWEDEPAKRHYDPYRFIDLSLMFRSDIVKSGDFYKYDYNLSISKLFNSHITWGSMLGRDYDPKVAEDCYAYRPARVRYSLPQQEESRKDNWRVFLTNNYRDFQGPVTSVKSINRTGALFMMNRQSPMQFMGVEELKLDGTGAKITIGDGALFNQALQNVVNTEASFEYGSCQNKYSVINTTHGVFWVSQNQGKVFQYAGQLNEISRSGMKWWFAKYLPSELLKVYQDYPLFDNPVGGVGVQMIYDNTNEVLYLSKKDYKPKRKDLLYDSRGFYEMVNQIKTYRPFTDTDYWEDASWTISYDCKNQMWLSFHDWKPTFMLPSKTHFMSVNGSTVWKHNSRCDLFCNFYGVDYPFDIEFVSATGQAVNSVRNVEYMAEAYRYYNDCQDKFHVLDENFDYAMIYNSEQVSGLLELVKKDKSNPFTMLTFPQIGPSSIKIEFSKEENKYRFNQFWDITKDRGEFTNASTPMFITKANGYDFQINPQYVNYQKSPLERKKFRHNVNRVFLRKLKSGDVKLMFKLSNQKLLQSPR